ncbi:hypothetical protein HDV00_004209 [Rhizophlyctis rosea]|nr:hypothetical protein HDV00_004209 [Rhizophlyctis rosea]
MSVRFGIGKGWEVQVRRVSVRAAARGEGHSTAVVQTSEPQPEVNSSRPDSSEEPKRPPAIEATFTTDEASTTTTPIDPPPQKEFYTADMNPNILNLLYGQAIKALNVAAAFTSSAFEKNPRSGALNVGQKPNREGGSNEAAAKLKMFFLQHHQHTRAGAADNPTTANSVVPMVQRQYLSPTSGPPVRARKANMLRVLHAKQDAEMYKKPVEQLFTDYFTVRPTTMSGFQSIVEERIAFARRQGAFDNIRGRGKPIDLDTDEHKNPFITPTEFFVHRMVKAQGYVPPWIELGKEIEEDTEKVRRELRKMWKEFCDLKSGVGSSDGADRSRESRDESRFRVGRGQALVQLLMRTPGTDDAAERRREERSRISAQMENVTWEQFAREWADLRIAEINDKIRKFNIEAPPGIPQKMRLGVQIELTKAGKDNEAGSNVA